MGIMKSVTIAAICLFGDVVGMDGGGKESATASSAIRDSLMAPLTDARKSELQQMFKTVKIDQSGCIDLQGKGLHATDLPYLVEGLTVQAAINGWIIHGLKLGGNNIEYIPKDAFGAGYLSYCLEELWFGSILIGNNICAIDPGAFQHLTALKCLSLQGIRVPLTENMLNGIPKNTYIYLSKGSDYTPPEVVRCWGYKNVEAFDMKTVSGDSMGDLFAESFLPLPEIKKEADGVKEKEDRMRLLQQENNRLTETIRSFRRDNARLRGQQAQHISEINELRADIQAHLIRLEHLRNKVENIQELTSQKDVLRVEVASLRNVNEQLRAQHEREKGALIAAIATITSQLHSQSSNADSPPPYSSLSNTAAIPPQ